MNRALTTEPYFRLIQNRLRLRKRTFNSIRHTGESRYLLAVRAEIPAFAGMTTIVQFSMEEIFCVYIVTNKKNGVLYTGVTSDLPKRIYEHKNKTKDGFTKKYNLTRLVHYEVFGDAENAIHREKCIKEWQRQWKIELIEKSNPEWRDLYPDIT